MGHLTLLLDFNILSHLGGTGAIILYVSTPRFRLVCSPTQITAVVSGTLTYGAVTMFKVSVGHFISPSP